MTDGKKPGRVMSAKYVAGIEKIVDTIVFSDSGSTFSSNEAIGEFSRLMEGFCGEYLSGHDIIYFTVSEVYGFISRNGDYISQGSVLDAVNSGVRNSLIAVLKSRFERFPIDYIVTMQLPQVHGGFDDINISPSLTLRLRSPSLPENGAMKQLGLNSNVSELRMQISGYASNVSQSPGTDLAISSAKQLAFLLVNLAGFAVNYSSSRVNATIAEFDCEPMHLEVPESVSRSLARLSINDLTLIHYSDGVGLLNTKFRAPKDLDERKSAIRAKLNRVTEFYACASELEFSSICAAIEWFQDSQHAENETVAFIAACIGLEAILSSGERMEEMSKRLADRYSFMLGEGSAERKKMQEDYAAILKVRGALVHARAIKLSSADRDLLFTARRMLSDVILHEIHGMLRRAKPSK